MAQFFGSILAHFLTEPNSELRLTFQVSYTINQAKVRQGIKEMGTRASHQGLKLVDELRKNKGWNRQDSRWWREIPTSVSTLKRFWEGKAIQPEVFIKICQAVGLENWGEIVDNSPVHQQAEISYCFDYDNDWVGRTELINQLVNKVRNSCRVLILTGITGIGKTALAERLAWELKGEFINYFIVKFDSQDNTDFASVTAQLLISWGEKITPEDRQDTPRLLNWLVRSFQENPYLVVLDSLEFILKGNVETGWSNFQDEWWEKLFQKLLSINFCQSRIILTSQDLPAQLEAIALGSPNCWHCEPVKGFIESEWLELFENIGLEIEGESEAVNYLKRIGAAYEGHPLALRTIAGEIVSPPFNSNVVAYWRKYGHEVEEVEQIQKETELESREDQLKLDRYNRRLKRAVKQRVEKTFDRLAKDVYNAYVLLSFGSVYRRPIPEKFLLKTVARLGWDEDKQQVALDALRDRYLIEEEIINDELVLRQHNLIRSVALNHLRKWDNER